MSKFYKCEVFEYVDIIEVDGKETRHVHNESGNWYGGLSFMWFHDHYILVSSDYRETKVITYEEAVELSEERNNLINTKWLYSESRSYNRLLEFRNKRG